MSNKKLKSLVFAVTAKQGEKNVYFKRSHGSNMNCFCLFKVTLESYKFEIQYASHQDVILK